MKDLGKGLKKVIPKRVKITDNFYMDELVDPHTYFNDSDHGLNRLDPDAINCLQLLRTIHGKPITVNNWWNTFVQMYLANEPIPNIIKRIENSDSLYKWSGYRPEHCRIGAKKSAHKFGKAFDPKGDEDKLFSIVKDNAEKFLKTGLKRLENPKLTNGWLHLDTESRNHKEGKIRVINLNSHAFDITA